MRYTESVPVHAAQYHHGKPLDDLLAVARWYHCYARVIEVPQWRVLLVGTFTDEDLEVPDYRVVEDGGWLVYRPSRPELVSVSGEEFGDIYQKAAATGVLSGRAPAAGTAQRGPFRGL